MEKCKYCKDRSLNELPMRSNADMSKVGALIAFDGEGGKEIVFHVNGTAYGIQIDFCPKCGKKLREVR